MNLQKVVNNLKDTEHPNVVVTLNPFCDKTREYTMLVVFGVISEGHCEEQQNVSKDIKPNEPATFDVVMPMAGQEYCLVDIILNGTSSTPTNGKLVYVYEDHMHNQNRTLIAVTNLDDISTTLSAGIIAAIVICVIVLATLTFITAILIYCCVCNKPVKGN